MNLRTSAILGLALLLPAAPGCDAISGLTEGGTDAALEKLGAGSYQELLEALQDVVNGRLQSNGLSLSEGLAGQVNDLLKGGVDNLLAEPSANGVTEAKTNLGGFVDRLLGDAEIEDGVADMDEGAFQGLLDSVCPLAPFCE